MSERSNEYLERMLKTLEIELDIKEMELEELHERVMALELSTDQETSVEEEGYNDVTYLKGETTLLKKQLRIKDIEVQTLQHTLEKNQKQFRFCHELLNEFRGLFYYPAKLAHEGAS